MSDELKTCSKVGCTTVKGNRRRNETTVYTVLKFQFDHSCFQAAEVSAICGENWNKKK